MQNKLSVTLDNFYTIEKIFSHIYIAYSFHEDLVATSLRKSQGAQVCIQGIHLSMVMVMTMMTVTVRPKPCVFPFDVRFMR